MSLLLATTTAQILKPGAADSHGWRSDIFTDGGLAEVSIQPNNEYGNLSAESSDGYSSGPGQPGQTRLANIYAEPDAPIVAGDRLVADGETWECRSVIIVRGPGGPDLDAMRITASYWNEVE